MPSWPVHLAIAKKLSKKLNLGDEFIIGNVLPDVLQGWEIQNPSQIVNKKSNHFVKKLSIDIDSFLNKYKNEFKNPLVKGYLAHLMTDEFFNKYTYEKHILYKGDKVSLILKNGEIKTDFKEKPREIKQKDFKIFGQKLINDSLLTNVKTNINLNNPIKESPITKEDLNKTIIKINNLNNDKNSYDEKDYTLFTEKELLNLYNKCYESILKKLTEYS